MTVIRNLNDGPQKPLSTPRPSLSIGLVTCFHERHELTPLWLMRLANLRRTVQERAPKGVLMEVRAFAAVTEGDKVTCDLLEAAGVAFVEVPNRPLGRKWNAAAEVAMKDLVANPNTRPLTHLMVVGQDDLVGRDYISRITPLLLSGVKHVAPRSVGFIEPSSRRACGWRRDLPASYPGAGRVLSTRAVNAVGMRIVVHTIHPITTPAGVLEPGRHRLPLMMVDYITKAGRGSYVEDEPAELVLWGEDLEKGLDCSIETLFVSLGHGPSGVDNFPHEIIDVKTEANIWGYDHLASFSEDMKTPVAQPIKWDAMVNERHFWRDELDYINQLWPEAVAQSQAE